ncbi:POK8 protein, partial [Ibidorhyncha struthersii]|nr:POK8 protein [Ibidorhyncha struthersii]
FFSIPLHPEDTEKFAFTVPTLNNSGPTQRYEWTVLPQGMANSPTMCQFYVNKALQPWKKQHPHVLVYHYMDDILLASSAPITEREEDALKTQLL